VFGAGQCRNPLLELKQARAVVGQPAAFKNIADPLE
jgi:hypothetical protein